MLFTQTTFFLFLPLVLIGHLLTRPWKTANNLFLLLASWCFFLYWSFTDFFIFGGILSVNFVLLQGIQKSSHDRGRRALLLLSLFVSLGTLAFFKYRLFLGDNICGFLQLVGLSYQPPSNSIAIPLAISFYTFHMISLVSDVYARKYSAPSFLDYCLYLSFFPQILAGPIVRGNQMLPQIQLHPRDRVVNVPMGIYAFCLGFFFKAVIADNISEAIDPYWTIEALQSLTTVDAWCVILLYTAQIFADFGGYSFMAIGLGRLFGIELPENFNAPYLATSFQEFWNRWHITLSSFLRDYLYIGALGGSRCAKWRLHANLIVTMLLGGLWHGPAWNFMLWGGIHGLGLSIERLLGFSGKEKRSPTARALWYGVVQLCVIVAWVPFRSPDLHFALAFLRRMFALDGRGVRLTLAPSLATALVFIIPVVLHHVARAAGILERRGDSLLLRGALAGALAYIICVSLHAPRGFIYFVF